MAKKASEKFTNESLDAMEKADKPAFIKPEDWGGEGTPSGYKTCRHCKVLVRGPQTKECPSCKGDISPLPKPEGTSKPAARASNVETTKTEVSYPKRLLAGKSLVKSLGADAIDTLTTIKNIGSIDDAITAVNEWGEFVTGAGKQADTMLALLRKTIDGEEETEAPETEAPKP